jgi:hypothetical protein
MGGDLLAEILHVCPRHVKKALAMVLRRLLGNHLGHALKPLSLCFWVSS